MTKEQLLAKLNWFYTLEINQVDSYLAQSKAFKNDYMSLVLERIAYIEQQHVENIAAKIRELGGTPSKLGDILATLAGNISGSIFALSGPKNILKINIFIEKKAMEDYTNLIKLVMEHQRDKELIKILQHNLVDEDLHTAWFSNELLNYQD